MTNVSAVEKMAELMQQMEENSPRVAALQYCLKQVAEKVEEAEKRNAELEARCASLAAENAGLKSYASDCASAVEHWNSWADLEDKVPHTPENPATDAFLAEVRAQARNEGINYAASRLAAAFNHGFVDKPLAEVYDVVRMIMTAKEDLANDPMPAADGLSGEYAEKSLEDFAAQLHEGGAEKQSILSDEDCHAFVKAFTKGAAQ